MTDNSRIVANFKASFVQNGICRSPVTQNLYVRMIYIHITLKKNQERRQPKNFIFYPFNFGWVMAILRRSLMTATSCQDADFFAGMNCTYILHNLGIFVVVRPGSLDPSKIKIDDILKVFCIPTFKVIYNQQFIFHRQP